MPVRVRLVGLGAYAYNVENTVLGSRGLDDWACNDPPLFVFLLPGPRCIWCGVCVTTRAFAGITDNVANSVAKTSGGVLALTPLRAHPKRSAELRMK